MTKESTALADLVTDALDDLAALGLHWTRNRERGRMPSGIRQAMLIVAQEALAYADMAEREMARKFDALCGPTAYARNSADQVLRCGPNGECSYCGKACDEPCSRFCSNDDAAKQCGRKPA
jgi:hypothetical protein